MGNYPCKTEVTLAVVDTGAEHLYKYNGLYKLNTTEVDEDTGWLWPTKIGDTSVTTFISSTFEVVMPQPTWWESEEGNAIWMGDDLKWRVGSVADRGTKEGDIMSDSGTGTTCPHVYDVMKQYNPCIINCGDDPSGEVIYGTEGPSQWQYKAPNEEWIESDTIFTATGQGNYLPSLSHVMFGFTLYVST